eukprot:5084846-Amphidinium_carterae.1
MAVASGYTPPGMKAIDLANDTEFKATPANPAQAKTQVEEGKKIIGIADPPTRLGGDAKSPMHCGHSRSYQPNFLSIPRSNGKHPLGYFMLTCH